ncbi:MAG: Stp1/IreP family PP2C-type Ser/Thr phosphatase [Thermoleophilia bacterium]|nr:Stp1/IreP family PP2C-type Ser/Thr phosphatase [Thermoleophilia bacterium]
MRLRAAVASDRGLIRPANEDSFFLRRGLYAVCDGMGGARAGEVASQMACLGLLALDPAMAGQKELRTAIVNTNQAIISRSLAEEHLLGMGTTLTAVLVKEGSLILAHVGDSRAYLFHDGSLIQLSDDHSWVGEMVRRGELTPAQAAVHPHRSVITRALGTDGQLEPDISEVDIGEGDRILVCSDGLSGFVSDANIAELLARDEAPSAVVESLVRAALAGGGEDNVTVVVIDVVPGSEQDDATSHSDDQVGDRILVGPSDRGDVGSSSAHRGRRAGAAVRERLSRRVTPPVRPVGAGPLAASGPSEEDPIEATPQGDRSVALQGTAETHQGVGVAEAVAGQPAGSETVTRPAAAPGIAAPETATPGIAAPGTATPETAAPRKRRRRWILLALAVVLVVAIAIAGFAVYNSNVYYVGAYDTDSTTVVALYRGLPGSLLGITLSSVVQFGTVEYQSLAPHLRERVDTHDLVSKEEGRAFLETLDEQQ